MTDESLAATALTISEVADCPYRGLRSYTEVDADYFFGRDSDRDLVIANLMASRLTVLYGPSGVGKSSLLQAGVMPHLRRMPEGAFSYIAVSNAIIVYHASWRDNPLAELGPALLNAVPSQGLIEDLVQEQPALSVELLRMVTERLNADVYLLFDQFEEEALYQTGPQGEAFAAELGRIITTPNLRVAVLLGVREDSLAKLDRLEAHVPGIFNNSLRLGHLDKSAARQAIEQPLARHNAFRPSSDHVIIEPDLVEELLEQLQTGFVSVGDAGRGGANPMGESIETPYLQLVMTRLWAAEVANGSHVLRLATLGSLGGAERIVRTHLDAVMARLTEQHRETAADVFRYLVTPSGTKISHSADDLAEYAGVADRAQVHDVLERLAAGRERVLRPVPPPAGSDDPPRYEIFHDVLAPAVLDWRRRYVAERERIASEQTLLSEKRAAEEQHREAHRRLRLSRLVSGALALLLLASAIGFISARQNAVDAEHRAMMAEYQRKAPYDPAGSLTAALRAWDERHTPEAETAVRLALEADTQRLVIPSEKGYWVSSEFSPDGRYALAAGTDGLARLFDAETGQLVHTYGPSGASELPQLTQASTSADGSIVMTVAKTGQVHLYDLTTERDLGELTAHGDGATAAWGTLGTRQVALVSGSFKPAQLWDAERGQMVRSFGSDATYAATLSRDAQHVVTLDYPADLEKVVISVWDPKTGRLEQRSEPVGTNAVRPQFAGAQSDSIVFYVAENLDSEYWEIAFWNWRQGPKALHMTEYQSRQDGQLAVSPDGRLVAAPRDKRVTMFDAETGEAVGSVPEEPDWINDVAFSSDNRWLVTAGNDGKTRVWIANQFNNGPLIELLGHRGGIVNLQFDPADSKRIMTTSYDGSVRTWQIPARTTLVVGDGWMMDAHFSLDGKRVVATEETGTIRVYVRTGLASPWKEEASTEATDAGTPGSAGFTADGRQVVFASPYYSTAPWVWTWQSESGPRRLQSSDDITYISALALSGDGRHVAAGDDRGRVIVWDIETAEIVARIPSVSVGYQVAAITYVPPANLIAVAGTDGSIRLWDPSNVDEPPRILEHGSAASIRGLAASADGVYLVSSSQDHQVRVWGVADGRLQTTIDGPPSTAAGITFSPDGQLLALGAGDAAVHVWRWQDRHKLAVLRRHGDFVNSVEFSPDGETILTASDDSTVAMYPCTSCGPFEDLLEVAKQRDRSRR